MKERAIWGSLLVVLSTALLFSSLEFKIANTQDLITINSDGTFSPSGAPLTKSIEAGRDVFTLTSDISGKAIVVAKYSVTIDGAGHSLSGTAAITAGIVLSGIQGVIVRNLEIKGFQKGVAMQDCGSCQISSNTITDNEQAGIEVRGVSTWNNIRRNNIKENDVGVSLNDNSQHNTITSNMIEQNQLGIEINDFSKENIVADNSFINNARQYGNYNGHPNKWNSDYDGGKGNYWSDYATRGYPLEDSRKGPSQDQPGSDGFWDQPYVIYQEADVKDNYPLVVSPFAGIFLDNVDVIDVDGTQTNYYYNVIGHISPPVENVEIILMFTSPSLSEPSFNKTAITDFAGHFEYRGQTGGKDEVGSWTVRALLERGSGHSPAMSSIRGFIIPGVGPSGAWAIPGFPWESILIGMLLALSVLYVGRKKRGATRPQTLKQLFSSLFY